MVILRVIMKNSLDFTEFDMLLRILPILKKNGCGYNRF